MADEQSVTIEEPQTVIIEGSNSEEIISEEEHSDAVEIAQIEADRDVTIAAIHSETEQARIEAETERVEAIEETNREYNECRQEIQRLTETVEALEQRINSLIPPTPLVEEVAEQVMEELPIVSETDLIQPSTAAPTVEMQTEVSEESEDESPVEEIPNRVPKFIAI